MNEHIRTNRSYSARRNNYKSLVAWEKFFSAACSTSTNYPIGSQRSFQPSYSQAIEDIPSHGSIMAGALSVFPLIRFREGRTSPRPVAKDISKENRYNCEYNIAYYASKCDPLEYTQYGTNKWGQSIQCYPYMETTQFKTSSHQNVQTQPRQAVCREASRHCWALSESAGQSNCFLRGRKKPDSGARTDTAVIASAAWYSRKTNPRLHASWHNNVICGIEHARRYRNWGLHAAPQAPGIHQIFTDYRCKSSCRLGSTPDRRQLWNTQTCRSPVMAQTASAISSAFYSHIQFMVEHGRTLVLRYNVKKNSSRFIQKCKRTNCSYKSIY